MKVYIDIILFINFFIDFLVLISVSVLLKRKSRIKRIILSSLIGSVTVIVLFLEMNSLELFLFKIFTSVIMVIIAFGFKNVKYFFNNLLFFYSISITLGGVLYLLKLEFHSLNIFKLNFNMMVILSPLILYIYIKELKELKLKNSFIKKVNVYLNNKIYNLTGYIDSANTLKEPYGGKYVIIVNNKKIENEASLNNFIYVPYKTINNTGLIKCLIPDLVYIEDVGIKRNVVIGLSKEKINIDGIDCLLNVFLTEGK